MVPVHCISRSQELKIDFLTKNFKNLLVRNHWTDFNIILQKCSFGDPLPRLIQAIWIRQKLGYQGAGLIFPIYVDRKLTKSSCQKSLDRFPYTFVEMFLWWASTKIVQAIWIHQKTWPPGGWGAYFSYIPIWKTEKIFLSETTWLISIFVCRNVPLVILYQDYSSHFDSSKNMAASGRGLFSLYYLYRKLKKSSCQKPVDRFPYNL